MAVAQPIPARTDRLAYPILLALGALDAAGYSLIAPVLPSVVERTGAGPALIGGMVAAFPLAMLAGFALAGRGIQRVGTRPVLLFGLALLAVGSLGFAMGDDLAVYAGSRAVMGVGSGCVWIGVTFETLERWPGEEYVCMSRIFAAYSAGGLIGPLLGALGGITTPFAVYLAAVAVALALAALLRPPPHRRRFAADRAALRTRRFRAAAAAILFATLALGIVEGVLPLLFADRLAQHEVGVLYAAASLVVAGVAAAATRISPRTLAVASVVLVSAGIAIAGAATGPAIWVAALVVVAVGVGAGNTGSTGLLLDAVSPDGIVLAMVVWSQIGIVGYMLGPLAGGLVVEATGYWLLGAIPALAGVVVLTLLRDTGPATR